MRAQPSIRVDTGSSVIGARLANVSVCNGPNPRAVPVAIGSLHGGAAAELAGGFSKCLGWEKEGGDDYDRG